MRGIKFRGKSLNTGEWLESMTISKGSIKRKKDDIFIEVYENKWIGIDSKTLGEFTGLKDKYGKEIYEGDIVEFQLISKGVVNWNPKYCGFWIDFTDSEGKNRYSNFNVTFSDGVLNMCNTIAVIGNIYENPELLNS